MNNEATYKGREEVERLPAVDSDLENGTSDVNNGRNDSSENVQPALWGKTLLSGSAANGNRLSSTISSDPEKRDDMEIVDWDGPNDPENPYE